MRIVSLFKGGVLKGFTALSVSLILVQPNLDSEQSRPLRSVAGALTDGPEHITEGTVGRSIGALQNAPETAFPPVGKLWTYKMERFTAGESKGKKWSELHYQGRVHVQGVRPEEKTGKRIRFFVEISAPAKIAKALKGSRPYLEAEWSSDNPKPTLKLYGKLKYSLNDRDWNTILIDLFTQFSYGLPENRIGRHQAKFKEELELGKTVVTKTIENYAEHPEISLLRSETRIELDESRAPLKIMGEESYWVEGAPGERLDQSSSAAFERIGETKAKFRPMPFEREIPSVIEKLPPIPELTPGLRRFQVAFDEIS